MKVYYFIWQSETLTVWLQWLEQTRVPTSLLLPLPNMTAAVTKATRHITPYSGSSVAMAAITPCLPAHRWWAPLKTRCRDRLALCFKFKFLVTFLLIKAGTKTHRFYYINFSYAIKRFSQMCQDRFRVVIVAKGIKHLRSVKELL